jgi:hypothetical protein
MPDADAIPRRGRSLWPRGRRSGAGTGGVARPARLWSSSELSSELSSGLSSELSSGLSSELSSMASPPYPPRPAQPHPRLDLPAGPARPQRRGTTRPGVPPPPPGRPVNYRVTPFLVPFYRGAAPEHLPQPLYCLSTRPTSPPYPAPQLLSPPIPPPPPAPLACDFQLASAAVSAARRDSASSHPGRAHFSLPLRALAPRLGVPGLHTF